MRRPPLSGIAGILAIVLSAHGAGATRPRSIRIDPAASKEPQVAFIGKDSARSAPFLTLYAPVRDSANGAAMVVCPGGAYGMLARKKEGVEPSLWLRSLGIHAFLLEYRLGPAFHHPAQMEDGQRAVRWVRANAARFHLDPRRIGMLGFSAGGHLTATVATHNDGGDPAAADPVERVSCRPDFQILIYPVISMEAPFTHRASRINLLGRSPDAATLSYLSLETQVEGGAPPAFLVHAEADPVVAIANSQAYAEALRRAKVPVEFLAFVQGGHAFGLAAERNGEPGMEQLSTWPSQCAKWMEARGILGRPAVSPDSPAFGGRSQNAK
ncbi:MAG: esterase/lipase [Fibrobacteres bacterium]|nr:esterase/lipase [Fibrobacterota bacterium]